MPRKAVNNVSDKEETTSMDNATPLKPSVTPETPAKASTALKGDPDKANDPSVGAFKTDYIDSESSDIAKSLTEILSVPTETIQFHETPEAKSDVLKGYELPDQDEPVAGAYDDEPNFNSGSEDGGDSAMFEDNELLATIGVELIDMMMTYGAMAIAKDWENEERYAIKEKRKKKLEEPLRKILENREVKTAPELVFAFMLVVSYSPVWIEALQVRRAKKNAGRGGAVLGKEGRVSRPQPSLNVDVMPQRGEDVEGPDDEDVMAEALASFKPKRKSGRPVGSTDLTARAILSDDERDRAIERAKAMRKDGKSFASIAKDLNVSQATVTRWIRS
jgi:hypothetical protein